MVVALHRLLDVQDQGRLPSDAIRTAGSGHPQLGRDAASGTLLLVEAHARRGINLLHPGAAGGVAVEHGLGDGGLAGAQQDQQHGRGGLDKSLYFYNNGNMEKRAVLDALAALAQETRLDVFRLLVRAGSDGLSAGVIADVLELPSATLSFHLKELRNAGLAVCEREGRSLIYSASCPTVEGIIRYLTANCCQGVAVKKTRR